MDGDLPALPPGMELMRRLGAGAFGEVFLVRQTAINRLVAVKRILPHALSNPDNVERFRREAQVLAATDVASVVRVYDLRVDEQGALLVMEYVAGETLADRISRGPLPLDEALLALTDVAEALQRMAERGIVHRDIKPANVFLLPDGHAKLGDFGLARAIADDSSFRTAGGAPTGTPAYFPPEVSQGQGQPDPRSDAYSFAVMTFEALTGKRPFEAPDALALIIAHWEREPLSPADALPGMPRAAVQLLLKGLSKHPQDRPLPHELVAALAKVDPAEWPDVEVLPRPAPARQDDTVVRPGFTPPTLSTPSPVLPPARVTGRRRRLWPIAAVAVVAVGAVVGAGLVMGGSDPLAVTSVDVRVDEESGSCPEAAYAFLATVTTNGGSGEVTFQWREPDGELTEPGSVAVEEGTTRVQLGLDFAVRGTAPLEGEGELLIVSPGEQSASAAITYTCPSR